MVLRWGQFNKASHILGLNHKFIFVCCSLKHCYPVVELKMWIIVNLAALFKRLYVREFRSRYRFYLVVKVKFVLHFYQLKTDIEWGSEFGHVRIPNGQKNLVSKWSGFQMGSEIQTNGCRSVKNHLKSGQKCPEFKSLCFQMVLT